MGVCANDVQTKQNKTKCDVNKILGLKANIVKPFVLNQSRNIYITKDTQDNFAPFFKACTDGVICVCARVPFLSAGKYETIRDRGA